jgi:hypothetical protein
MNENMSKDDKILWEIYQKLYAASEPSANFDTLVENAPLNEFGQKEIPYMDYELDEDTFKTIVEDTLKKHKVSKYKRQIFRNTIYLGCSPKFKSNGEG